MANDQDLSATSSVEPPRTRQAIDAQAVADAQKWGGLPCVRCMKETATHGALCEMCHAIVIHGAKSSTSDTSE